MTWGRLRILESLILCKRGYLSRETAKDFTSFIDGWYKRALTSVYKNQPSTSNAQN